jgi:hypothetical protein
MYVVLPPSNYLLWIAAFDESWAVLKGILVPSTFLWEIVLGPLVVELHRSLV